ncbi:MAG: hypothetical protein P8Y92_14735 [Halioglobus sp.]
MNNARKTLLSGLAAAGILLASMVIPSAAATAAGIVESAQRAWITADGDVSGENALWKIVLDGSKDPAIPGRSIKAGNQIRVIFPPAYDLSNIDPGYPVADIPTPFPPVPPLPDMPCLPGNFQCTTGVFLQGWPEHPFFPPVLFHSVSIDAAANAFVFTALQDIEPDPPAYPGIKELFVLLNGVRNPAPGHYRLRVESQTGPGGTWETGSTLMHVLPRARPSINATSVFVKAQAGLIDGIPTPACGPGTAPPNPDNPVWQTTGVNAAAPYTWTFLLWGKNEEPLDDVGLYWVSDDHALLRRGLRTVGHIYIDAPRGAEGYRIETNPLGCGTYLPAAPIIATTPGIGPQPTGRLDLRFHTGNAPGTYTTTLTMNNGNSETMVVVAE